MNTPSIGELVEEEKPLTWAEYDALPRREQWKALKTFAKNPQKLIVTSGQAREFTRARKFEEQAKRNRQREMFKAYEETVKEEQRKVSRTDFIGKHPERMTDAEAMAAHQAEMLRIATAESGEKEIPQT
jgi:hypothetical protein